MTTWLALIAHWGLLSHAANVTLYRDQLVATVDERVCVNLDWHIENPESRGNLNSPWINTSVMTLNLQDSALRDYMRGIAPSILRIAGIEGDAAVYDFGGEIPRITFRGRQTICPGPYCLVQQRWVDLHQFCEDVGCSILFGLNGVAGKGGREKPTSDKWNPANAATLITFTAKKNLSQTMFGWSLGDELEGVISPDQMAQSFSILRTVLDKGAIVIGPDIRANHTGPYAADYLRTFLQLVPGNTVDAVGYHISVAGDDSPIARLYVANDPSFLDRVGMGAVPMMLTARSAKLPILVSSSSLTHPQGQDNTTNAFASTFWYVESLGRLSLLGHKLDCRQTIIGGYYGLLSYVNDEELGRVLMGSPDYYILWMWSHLMGPVVLNATSEDKSVRVFAHCTNPKQTDWQPGSVSMAFVNLHNNTQTEIKFINASKPVGLRHVWSFSSDCDEIDTEDACLRARQINLNGKVLFGPVVGALYPMIEPAVSPLFLPPHSITFLHLPYANIPACSK